MLAILHITDLHFGKLGTQLFPDQERLAISIARAANSLLTGASERLLIASGDFVYKGQPNGFLEAERFLRKLCPQVSVPLANVVLCPGNHDLDANSPSAQLGAYSRFAHNITGDAGCTFAKNNSFRVERDSAELLVVNSAYHHDTTYGLVDVETLPNLDTGKTRVAIVHHNAVGIHRGDSSSIRNAYPFLVAMQQRAVQLLFHGHQHMFEILPIGSNRCVIVGAGSLNFKSLDSMGNQFNVVTVDGSAVAVNRFIYSPDVGTTHGIGGWAVFPTTTTIAVHTS